MFPRWFPKPAFLLPWVDCSKMRNCLISFVIALSGTVSEMRFEASRLCFSSAKHHRVKTCRLKPSLSVWGQRWDETLKGKNMTKFNSRCSDFVRFPRHFKTNWPENLLLPQNVSNDANVVTSSPSFSLNSFRPRFLFSRHATLHTWYVCIYIHTILWVRLLNKSLWQRRWAHTTGDPAEEMLWLDFGGPCCIDLHVNEGIKSDGGDGAARVLLVFAIVMVINKFGAK